MGKEEKKGIGNGKNDTIRIAIVGIGDVPFAIKSILQYYLRFNDFAPTHSLVVALFVFWVYFYFLFFYSYFLFTEFVSARSPILLLLITVYNICYNNCYCVCVIICRKTIPLIIIEEGSYEKDVLFYVNLGEPQMVGGKISIYISIVYTNTFPIYTYRHTINVHGLEIEFFCTDS